MLLVTGGAGFIGSHLVEHLLAEGERVRVLDNFATGKAANLAAVRAHPGLSILEGDIRDYAAVDRAMQGVEAVFHQAALVSVEQSVRAPAESFHNNAQGTFHVFEAARKNKLRRVIVASSAAVYGPAGHYPIAESAPARPASPYALDKHYAEQLAVLYSRHYALECVVLRYFNVYGPRQDAASPYSGVIAAFMAKLQAGAVPVVHGDGRQSRDFVYVKDVVAANVQALRMSYATAPTFACCNIAGGEETSLLALLAILREVAGVEAPAYDFAPQRAGDIRRSVACIDEASRLLDWRPHYDLRQGLAETYQQGAAG